ncbi:PQQ-dependent sugar dehydrogenase [Foetidibacter luteolus]|uniref:PQQ-dependent sugar dehydrogenase n=1 Tax=Foetidibacter luteolus TaxID=2608880 RepID=UPI00129A1D67|nr:PQQ-dependent sugar dehydrogenase [Foetidibacter luteolus]
MKKTSVRLRNVFMGAWALCGSVVCYANPDSTAARANAVKADADNAGLKLPPGFGALIAAQGITAARHIAATPQGDIYVKLGGLKDGKSIYLLHDADGDGKTETLTGFATFNGTGIAVKSGYLYASSNTDVYRYKLDAGNKVINPDNPETVVTGLIDRRQHAAKAIALDDAGNLYVNIGAFSNSCQEKDRANGSMGMQPCPILDSAAGIWQFKADKLNQGYGDGVRYATGLRNVVGLDWNSTSNSLFVMQHGRDGLHDLFPAMYDTKQSAELPSECMYEVKQGDNAGWPYIYYDQIQKKKILAPEYGGDGKKTGGEDAIDPVVAFPGHLAPNALLFYTGTMFPEKYKNGAFVAFHGSWNRAPEPQKGAFVAFVPFKDGKPSGEWEIFADNFAGPVYKSPGSAKHRPTGLAQGPDGSLYVSDDSGSTIYRIIYTK